jgi:hypothetical protein
MMLVYAVWGAEIGPTGAGMYTGRLESCGKDRGDQDVLD